MLVFSISQSSLSFIKQNVKLKKSERLKQLKNLFKKSFCVGSNDILFYYVSQDLVSKLSFYYERETFQFIDI